MQDTIWVSDKKRLPINDREETSMNEEVTVDTPYWGQFVNNQYPEYYSRVDN